MKNKSLLFLACAVVFQFLVLTGMYVKAAMPLWTGTEIKVATVPIDPRSLLRGNYARMRYDFSQISTDNLPDNEDIREGERVYLALSAGPKGVYVPGKLSLKPPADEVFIRGRIEYRHSDEETEYFHIKYGIEAFFAPKEQA
ncbi:MAG: GDYXXLXY domain-containing protein, partial [Pseudomonadales bacterium]